MTMLQPVDVLTARLGDACRLLALVVDVLRDGRDGPLGRDGLALEDAIGRWLAAPDAGLPSSVLHLRRKLELEAELACADAARDQVAADLERERQALAVVAAEVRT